MINKKGFSLIEMLVVIAIIAVLVAIVVPVVSNSVEKACEATDGANIRSSYAQVLTQAITEEKGNYWNEESGIWISAPINLTQKKSDWQTDEMKDSLAGLGSQVGEPQSGGNAQVEFHPNGESGHPTVIIRYTDGEGTVSINYSSSQSVGKYVFSEMKKLLDSYNSGENIDADYKKVFSNKGSNIDKQLTLPNGQTVTVKVFNRDYDTFEDTKTRLTVANTATLIYNEKTGKLSTIIYYDGKNYSSWSYASDYDAWGSDDAWLENDYNK